jgi:hypothetical protein
MGDLLWQAIAREPALAFTPNERSLLVPALVLLDPATGSILQTTVLQRSSNYAAAAVAEDEGTRLRFDRTYDRSGLPLLEDATQRTQGGAIAKIIELRRRKLLQRSRKVVENRLRNEGARQFREGLEERERKRAVRAIMGLRQSFTKYRIMRKIICKEDAAVRDARKHKAKKRLQIRCFRLNSEAYRDGFDEAMGMSEAEYMEAVSKDAEIRMMDDLDLVGEEYDDAIKGHREEVIRLHRQKVTWLSLLAVQVRSSLPS